MDSQPQSELSGPQLPFPGTETVIGAKNRAVIEPSTRVIEGTNAAPSRTADWGTMASPMYPIVVHSDTPPSLGRFLGPQVRKNSFVALLLTNLTPKTAQFARLHVIPMAIWVRLVKLWS